MIDCNIVWNMFGTIRKSTKYGPWDLVFITTTKNIRNMGTSWTILFSYLRIWNSEKWKVVYLAFCFNSHVSVSGFFSFRIWNMEFVLRKFPNLELCELQKLTIDNLESDYCLMGNLKIESLKIENENWTSEIDNLKIPNTPQQTVYYVRTGRILAYIMLGQI